jgi:FMN phosphatase YigB (HAD superfamily)/lambda repressor-like predicted transcriptional regulator
MSEEKRLGRVVQNARKKAGLTQQALCQKTGLSYSTLAKIERGAIKAPSVFTIRHIALSLGISLDELLMDVAQAKPSNQAQTTKKVSRNGVKFVYFDMNGCLVQSAVTKTANLLATEAGVTTDIVESIFWQMNSDVCRGDKSIDELNTVLADRLGMLVDWNKYYLSAVEATPGMSELVEWVSRNYHIGIITNTLPGLVGPMLATGVLPNVKYDAIIDSSEVRALKPEPRMFEIAAERAGVAPHEILLVDDDHLNLSSAGQLGWQTISFHSYQAEESIVAVSTALQPVS